MFQGKTKDALRLLTERDGGEVVHLDDPVPSENFVSQSVLDILKLKHPQHNLSQQSLSFL